jgi:hypothetical protein
MAVSEENVSRRNLLKKAGAGAIVLGAGGIMTSSAYANQVLDVCIRQALDDSVAACGACANQAACGDGCGCVPTTNGCCFCHQGVSCADAIPCRYNQHCPAGWKCAAATCCGPTGICVPACGAVAAASGGALSTPG